ncbi:hypothetical protein FDF36_09540 [Bacteroides fragilis]|nr:hypothetical protein [Bacteroides fragilis]
MLAEFNITKYSDYSVSSAGTVFFSNAPCSLSHTKNAFRSSIFHPRFGKFDSWYVIDMQIDVSVILSVYTI